MTDERYERIKDIVERGYKLDTKNCERLIDEIEKLREEKVAIMSAKEVTVNIPPLPTNDVIEVLQKQVIDLQVHVGTLESRIRNKNRGRWSSDHI